jgi:chitinase
MHLSVAASASPYSIKVAYDVPTMDAAIDYWNLMDYDYFVSDLVDANVTAPNSLLHSLDLPGFDPNWSSEATIQAYLDRGATASKMAMGLAYYGHTWYTPNIKDDSW